MSGSVLAIANVLSKTAVLLEPCDRPMALAGVPDMSLPCMRTLSALKTRMPAALVLAMVLPAITESETGFWPGWKARPTAPWTSWYASSPPVSSGMLLSVFRPTFTNALLRTEAPRREPAPSCWMPPWQVSSKRLSSTAAPVRGDSVPAGRPISTAGGAKPGRHSKLLNVRPLTAALSASIRTRELPVRTGPPSAAVPFSDVRVRLRSMTSTVSSYLPSGTTTAAGPGGALAIAYMPGASSGAAYAAPAEPAETAAGPALSGTDQRRLPLAVSCATMRGSVISITAVYSTPASSSSDMSSGPWAGAHSPPYRSWVRISGMSYGGWLSSGAPVPSRFFMNTGMPTLWPSTVAVRSSSLYIETVSLSRHATKRRSLLSSRTMSRAVSEY